MSNPPVGSYGVTATGGFIGWAIRLLTFSRYNHAFIVGPRGFIVEAQPGGARIGHISKYPNARYNLHTVLPEGVGEQIWRTALGFTTANNGKGIGYGWLDDVALGLRFFGIWIPWINERIARQDRLQCAQLVDLAYSRNGVTLFENKQPLAVDPGDLAELQAA
jgi:hypothetical protein